MIRFDRRLGFLLLAPLAFVIACGEPKASITEALNTDPEKALLKDYKPTPKPRPDGLPPPTDAEFKAWNRKDPEGEKHLYKWDRANLAKMRDYWEELECFREKVREEGEKAFGAEPGSPQEEAWFQFKRVFIPHINGWQQRLFANEPRILEKSKFIGNILEAHELIMNGYPDAFNNGDRTSIEKNDAHWLIVDTKVRKYAKLLDGEWREIDLTNAKEAEAHRKVCEKAMLPPDRDKLKKKKKKGVI